MNIFAVDTTPSVVTATLTNGSQLQAHFQGGTPPQLSALTPQLSLAAGATIAWPMQALALNHGVPMAGQAVAWQSVANSGISSAGSSAAITTGSGIATKTLTAGPLTEGQLSSVQACLNGTSQCVSFTALGARPEYATVQALSGASQSMSITATPSHRHLLPGHLRLGATLPATRPLRPGRATLSRKRHRNLRHRRHRQLFPRRNPRSSHQHRRRGFHRQHQHRKYDHRDASVEPS
jgi:hypothetical protein